MLDFCTTILVGITCELIPFLLKQWVNNCQQYKAAESSCPFSSNMFGF